ncbi:MAG: hypothetical protein EZS28_054695, partial [Streblomastix strix]
MSAALRACTILLEERTGLSLQFILRQRFLEDVKRCVKEWNVEDSLLSLINEESIEDSEGLQWKTRLLKLSTLT